MASPDVWDDNVGITLPESTLGEAFRKTDWSQTPLGAISTWPQSLKISVNTCLHSRFPMFVWWGTSQINIHNDAYIPVLGLRQADALGKPARELWEDIWDDISQQVVDVFKLGKASWNERQKLVMHRNGYEGEIFFTWSYSPIYELNDEVVGLLCACFEDTAAVGEEQRRAEMMEAARVSEKTLRAWFNNAPGFIALLKGKDLVFDMVNEAYHQLVGHRQIEGLPVWEALPEVPGQGFERLLRSVFETGIPYSGRAMPLKIQRVANGPQIERFIDFAYQPVRSKTGEVVGIFAQGHDVTEQVLSAREIHEAAKRKDDFLATLAHELRNPLAPIRQAAAIAGEPLAGDKQKAWAVRVISRQSDHMAALLDDLLDVARIGQGTLRLRRETVDIKTIVATALETAGPAPGVGKGSTFYIRLPITIIDDAPGMEPPAPDSRAVGPLPSVVLVDDNVDALDTLTQLLLLDGYEVLSFSKPQEALEHFSISNADVAVFDIGMSVMDGYELARRVKELRPKMTLIALTGWG